MSDSSPTISVAMPAYNAEPWIADALRSVLEQTAPPDEVIVVDDGSRDGTVGEVEAFRDSITLIRQDNQGPARAFNTAFTAASGEYVAQMCADDLWEPRKLEWQREALRRHPEIDVAFGHATNFGLDEREYERPPGTGLLDRAALTQAMYERDLIPAPTAVIRRELHRRLGGFMDWPHPEDYEFWMRALRAGAVFYYEPRLLLRNRRHGDNVSSRLLEMREVDYVIHQRYASEVDPELASRVLAGDLRQIARFRMDAGERHEARRAFRASLAHRRDLRGLVGTAALALPGGVRVIDIARRFTA